MQCLGKMPQKYPQAQLNCHEGNLAEQTRCRVKAFACVAPVNGQTKKKKRKAKAARERVEFGVQQQMGTAYFLVHLLSVVQRRYVLLTSCTISEFVRNSMQKK